MRKIALICLLLWPYMAIGQGVPAKTTIQDTVANLTDSPIINNQLTITLPMTMTTSDGFVILQGTRTTVTIPTSGVFNIPLPPNLGAIPSGTYYEVGYQTPTKVFRETWIVPQSATPINLLAVRSLAPPIPTPMMAFAQISPPSPCTPGTFVRRQANGWDCFAPSGSGTVTSVGLTVPSWLNVSGSPVIAAGALTVLPAVGQTSHQVIGTCGTATSFAPCALGFGDISGTAAQNQIPWATPGSIGSTTPGSGAFSTLTVNGNSGLAYSGTWTSGGCVQATPTAGVAAILSQACGAGGGNHALLSATHTDTTAHAVARGDIIAGIGAVPSWTAVAKGGTNTHPKWNASGDLVASTLAASGIGSPTACTNQAVTGFTLNADAAPTSTCATITSAFTDTSIAKTGTDINTSNQVTGLHLASAYIDWNGSGGTSIANKPTLYYQTLQQGGTPQTQRGILNFINGTNMTVSCVDNVTKTDCTFTSSATGATAWSAITAAANANAGAFSASGNSWDWTATTIFKLRSGAALTSSANGDIGYDTTATNWHAWNGADRLVGLVSGSPANNDCAKFVVTGSKIELTTQGGACGGGGTPPTGTGFYHTTSGAMDAASKLVNLTAASDVAANQGTTSTVLHGNAAGQASFAAVVSGDLNITPTSCANQAVTAIGSGGVGTCTTITSAYTSGTFAPTAHNLLSASHGDTTTASAVRGDMIAAIGASPTWQRVAHSAASGGYWKWNGTDVVASTGAASGTGSPTACSNQFVTAFTLNADGTPTSTCTTATAAMVSNAYDVSTNQNIGAHYKTMGEVAVPNSGSTTTWSVGVDATSHQFTCKNSTGASCLPSGGGTVTSSAAAQYNLAAFTSATNIQGIAPTANGQCLMSAASNFATSYPSFQACPGGGSGTVSANSTANPRALAVYAAAGGSTTVGADTGAYSDGSGNLTVASITTGGTGPDTFTAIADGTTANSFWLSSTTANRFKAYVGGTLQQFAYASDLGTAAGKNVLGTGTNVATTSASAPVANRCVEMDTSGNLVLAAAACGSGGGVSTTGSPVSGQVAVMSGVSSITGYAGMTADASGNLSAASVTTTAAGAGSLQLTQGTAPAAGTTAVTISAPAAVTSYVVEMPGAAPTAGNTFLSCTAAAPSICSWAAGGGGGATVSGTPSQYQAAVWVSASAVAGVGPGSAKQIYVSGGPSANPTYIDFPDVHYIPSANCNNASAATAWNLPATNPPTVACRTGTNLQGGVLQFTAATHTAQFQIGVPADWDTSVNPSARIFLVQGNGNTGQTITMTLATGCGATDDQAFNAAQSFSNITTNATAFTEYEATLSNFTMTNCVAGGIIDVKIGVSSLGTNQAWVQMVAITFPRLLTVGAM